MTGREAVIAEYLARRREHALEGTATYHVLKERIEGDRGLVAVTWGAGGLSLLGILEVVGWSDGSWRVDGAATSVEHPGRAPREPWAGLAGNWDPHACWGGGRVHGDAVHRVRLVDASGQRWADDVVDNGIAPVMLSGGYDSPCTLELYDVDGMLLARQLHSPPPG